MNHNTQAVKDAILWAFEEMGGKEALCNWGKKPENQRDFYTKILPRVMPHEVVGAGGGNLLVTLMSGDENI